ncbi:hypothetical protein FOA43_003473 [Brettanomyces nanus]|uniref:glutathione-specific gamma-glutamylcyclotransferase n=1 Tax=Eeniella nana TaxID=13502 RepID=A0A875RW61_EENNA|nr:uncharacterized protein FOA43_003473 [Brettanomyces nanus]QPG76087.1 hypothetical protein FOA43_003473 [Brettanomyces nanus]
MTVEKYVEPLWLVGYGSLLFKRPLHDQEFSQNFTKFSGYLTGFARKFWQSSLDNRGTPQHKGRVVTIIPADDIVKNDELKPDILKYELRNYECTERIINDLQLLSKALTVWGCIYYIPSKYSKQASEYLDFREKDGYITRKVDFNVVLSNEEKKNQHISSIVSKLPRNDLGEPVIKSIVYIGTTENESFVGPENVKDTAKIIQISRGDSGRNIDYLAAMNDSLQNLDPTGQQRSRDPYLEDLVPFFALELGFSIPLKKVYRDGTHWPMLVFGILASILLVAGLVPPYFELAKRKGRVVGINFVFLAMDSSGAIFSMASNCVDKIDIMAMILYILVVIMEAGIFLSQFIWWLRFRVIKREADEADENPNPNGDNNSVGNSSTQGDQTDDLARDSSIAATSMREKRSSANQLTYADDKGVESIV